MESTIVSLRPFLSPSTLDERTTQANLIKHALSTTGFFHIINHKTTINPEQTASSYFSTYHQSHSKSSLKYTLNRGFIPLAKESGSQTTEWKEAFSYGYEPALDVNELTRVNNWPVEDGKFRRAMMGFYDDMVTNAHAITRAVSLSLGYDEDYLEKYCKHGHEISIMRILNYHVPPLSQISKVIGSSPHTDWGFLTLISTAQSGLQVFRDNVWVDVEVIENSLIINAGDYLAGISGYISPLHRVIPPTLQKRLSFVFFWYPDYESKIPVLHGGSSSLAKQDMDGNMMNNVVTEFGCFGAFMEAKWRQVARY
jgi:isopenicillin N synthase-like dioxygenase